MTSVQRNIAYAIDNHGTHTNPQKKELEPIVMHSIVFLSISVPAALSLSPRSIFFCVRMDNDREKSCLESLQAMMRKSTTRNIMNYHFFSAAAAAAVVFLILLAFKRVR